MIGGPRGGLCYALHGFHLITEGGEGAKPKPIRGSNVVLGGKRARNVPLREGKTGSGLRQENYNWNRRRNQSNLIFASGVVCLPNDGRQTEKASIHFKQSGQRQSL